MSVCVFCGSLELGEWRESKSCWRLIIKFEPLPLPRLSPSKNSSHLPFLFSQIEIEWEGERASSLPSFLIIVWWAFFAYINIAILSVCVCVCVCLSVYICYEDIVKRENERLFRILTTDRERKMMTLIPYDIHCYTT